VCDLRNSLGPILTNNMTMAEYVPENLSNKRDMLGKLLEEPNILEKIMTQVMSLWSFCVRTELDPHLQCCHGPNPQ